MSEQGVPIDEVNAEDFITVRAALVRRLGGANEALVWERVRYRTSRDSPVAYDRDERRWWATSPEGVGEEVGLSGPQARRALESLASDGFLTRAQHALVSNYDRRYSYSPNIVGRQMDVTNSADQSAGIGASDVPNSADVPLPEEELRKKEEESVAPEVQRLCALLADLVRANGFKVGAVGFSWWQACDRLMRIDGLTAEQIEILARWATSHEFWSANVRSMPALRKHVDQLRAQRNRELGKKVGKSTIEHGRNVDEILAQREAEKTGRKAIAS